ncbi:MAG: CD3072 family TudS-related putative desulfidase [Candidatus Bathyarchaeales archaeon]
MDKRSNKLALVAHCILNQNSRVFGLAEEAGMIREVIEVFMRNNVGVIQMPCPELAYAGLSRTPKTREQYDTLEFRRICKKVAEELTRQISEYKRHGITLNVVVGVDGSPSCGVKNSGIFIEELRLALDKVGVSAPFCEIDLKSPKESVTQIEKLIKQN